MNTPSPQQPPIPKVLVSIVFCTLALFSAVCFLRYQKWDFDDGMIVYRMVRNLLVNGDWSYNLGENHNASTSVLNTVLMSLGARILGDILLASHILGAFWIFLASFGIFSFFSTEWGVAYASVVAISAASFMAANSTWGLETHLFSAIILWFLVAESRGKNSWWYLGLAVLARPDAVVLVGLKFISYPLQRKPLPWNGVLKVVLITLPWVFFSLHKFGQVFPDTLSAKVWQGKSGLWGSGWIYAKDLIKHAIEDRWAIGRYVLGIIGAAGLLSMRRPLLFLFGFALFQQVAYTILNVPGYHWYFSFFDLMLLLGAAHCVFILLVRSAAFVSKQVRAPFKASLDSGVVFCCLCFAGMQLSQAVQDPTKNILDVRNEAYRRATEIIESANIPEGALAALEVGTVGYYSQRRIVDITGLTSKNPQYLTAEHIDQFFKLPPRIVIFHDPLWHFEQTLRDDLRFRVLYPTSHSIGHPAFPLQYFVLEDERVKIVEGGLKEYISAHYSPTSEYQGPELSSLSLIRDSCVLDQVNGSLMQTFEVGVSPTLLTLRGWAVDKESAALSNSVTVLLVPSESGRRVLQIQAPRTSREDVAQHVGRPEFVLAGYSAEASLLSATPGHYTVILLQARGQSFSRCETGRSVNISR